MRLVHTSKGPLKRDDLEVKYVFKEADNSLSVATEWFYKGELVRRDAWVNVFITPSLTGEQTKIG